VKLHRGRARPSSFARLRHSSLFPIFVLLSFPGRALALDPTSHISQYGHTAWRLQDGDFGSQPYAIAQTTDGYIWMGTRDGLFKFDGVRFARWTPPSGKHLPSPFVISLLGARDGSLWIGTEDGLAHLLKNHLFVYPTHDRWVIVSILEDRAGQIWVDRQTTGDRTHPLCRALAATLRCYGKEDGVDAFGSGPLAEDSSGELWVGASTTLVGWRPGAVKVYRPKVLDSNIGQSGVTGLASPRDGSLWVGIEVSGRSGGLQHMAAGLMKPFVSPQLNGANLEVLTLKLDHRNDLWVGTSQGLYRIRGSDVEHYGAADGLSSDWANGIFEDHEGNLWILTSQGIDMFRDLAVKSISRHEA
jgi:ligand-binding sensor domain-containing protein